MRRYKVQVTAGYGHPEAYRYFTEEELNEYSGEIHRIRVLEWPELYSKFSVIGNDERFSVKLVNAMGDDLEPLRSARMSTDNPTGLDSHKDDALRNRLWRDKHTSPFETNVMVLELVVPIFVLRQIDRHRTVSISNPELTFEDYDDFRKFTSRNEYSARYSVMPDLFYLPPAERFQRKGTLNKQGSGEPLTEWEQNMARADVELTTDAARNGYRRLIEMGVSTELARIVLPMNQGTKIRLQACLLNWLKWLELRLDPVVQPETRAYANAVAECIKLLWPQCWDTFEEYTLGATTLSRTERQRLTVLLERLRGHDDLQSTTAHTQFEALFAKVRVPE